MDVLKKKRKILYITYDGLTDALGQSQILSYLSQLSHRGNEFYILAFEKEGNYKKNQQRVEQIVKENKLHWIKKWYTKKPPVLSTLYDIYAATQTINQLQKQHGFDIVHCRGYIPALLGLALKKKYGVKFIFDMRGWWADEKVEAGSWSKPAFRPIYNYFKKKERNFFQQADFSVSLTEVGKAEIMNKFGVPAERTGVVPTCVNFEVFKEYSVAIRNSVRARLGIDKEARVLIYSGALGGNYDLSILTTSFATFNATYPNAYILILSKDELPPQLESAMQEAGIANYTVKNVSYSEVSDYLCASDVGLIFYKQAYSNIGRSPTKLGEYWASGIPVIATEGIGDLKLLEKKYPEGVVLVDQNLRNVKESLANLRFNNQALLRQYAEDYCSLDKGINFYENVYWQLTR